MILLQLFFSFLQIGLFSIGGGYAALPIIQEQVVSLHHWMTIQEFADIVTISQMTPGPIAINAASFVGTRIANIPGAVTATIAVVLPSLFIVLTLSFLYYKYRQLDSIQAVLKGLRPAVVALIASAGISLAMEAFWNGKAMDIEHLNIESVLLFVLGFFLLRRCKKNPITVMLICGIAALGIALVDGSLTFSVLLHE